MNKITGNGAIQVPQRVIKVLAANDEDLNLIPGTHILDGEN